MRCLACRDSAGRVLSARTFDELCRAMRGFGAFAIRTAGVYLGQSKLSVMARDNITILLNAILLFVVLNVYPQVSVYREHLAGGMGKFVYRTATWRRWLRYATLMIIFGIGYVPLSLCVALLARVKQAGSNLMDI